MFGRIRFFFADLRFWFAQRLRRGKAASPPEAGEAAPASDAPVAETVKPSKRPRLTKPSRPSFRRKARPAPAAATGATLPKRSRLSRPSGTTLLAFAAGLLIAAGGAAIWIALDSDDDSGSASSAPAPTVVIAEGEPEDPPELGFPEFATKNTTRISGSDAIANSVGAALAAFPSTGGVLGPDAVTMVAEDDWAAGIAASSLVADPIRAPILVGRNDEVPDLVLDALVALAPPGSGETEDDQLFAVGDVSVPDGIRTRQAGSGSPAEVAAGVEELRRHLTGEDPDRILLVSSDEPAYAMPAAAWAARSGDPVLFVNRDTVPKVTMELLEGYEKAAVFMLGPESVISKEVITALGEAEISAERISGEDPVLNAIAFARYAGPSGFGWNITDPGHGLVIANAGRPADAGAAAVLSASGKWGPLLLIEAPDVLPTALEGFLLDVKPGFVSDPTRAVYNHSWIIGNSEAVGVDVQAQVDDLTELTEVQSGTGQPTIGPVPGVPEDEPEKDSDADDNATP